MESFLANRPKGAGFSRPIPRSVSGARNNALRPFASSVPAQGDTDQVGDGSSAPANRHTGRTGDGSCESSRVEVERDDDGVVRRIVVHCACGQQVPVECEY